MGDGVVCISWCTAAVAVLFPTVWHPCRLFWLSGDRRRYSSRCSRLNRPWRLLPNPPGFFPLLLLPGAHARTDVPAIRDRLRSTGANVSLLPFLGAWTSWWDAVLSALPLPERRDAVLVHHPLRPGVADRFLTMLSSQLALPLVSFDAWPEFQQRHPRARPLPLALAPNRMTEALSEAGGLPPLLEHPPTRQALIDLLVSLP